MTAAEGPRKHVKNCARFKNEERREGLELPTLEDRKIRNDLITTSELPEIRDDLDID